ncbi:MAG TPA: hypothetical protein VM755_19830 [Stellaceae bacterium]|nr:hypothetical protein [Stellaceae bacterium]
MQDHFVATGHDETTPSATFTFIRRRGAVYAVTCRHVVDALAHLPADRRPHFPTLAIQLGRSFLNLSGFGPQGFHHALRCPSADPDGADIAIAPLDNYWELLASRKNKIAIDLDNWHEPDWSHVRYCAAAGYLNEHKRTFSTGDGDKIANQLAVVVAEVSSAIGRSERRFTLSSQLSQPHGYYFSGLSGGPVYAIEGDQQREVPDGELFPIGIIFEGFPAGQQPSKTEIDPLRSSSYLTGHDLFLRALTLAPEFFDEWLQHCGF